MKILTVLGARPQFIKAFALSPSLRQVATEVLVHTGQHYDHLMSEVFFSDLGLPKPNYELGVGSGTPGDQTGRMLSGLDEIISREMPDAVLVYGDTNSTLAGALSAVKLNVPIAHVEAGLRSFNRAMPEEINRVVTDHVATRLYCPTEQSVKNLAREGITQGVRLTGDVMDVALSQIPLSPQVRIRLGLVKHTYYVATVHRKENTDNPTRLAAILEGLASLDAPVILPLHPRTRQRIQQSGIDLSHHRLLEIIEPLGYPEMMSLMRESRGVLTDSGGLQREAAAFGMPCYVLRDETEWVELVDAGRARLVGADAERIRKAVLGDWVPQMPPSGLSQAANPVELIVADLMATWGGS